MSYFTNISLANNMYITLLSILSRYIFWLLKKEDKYLLTSVKVQCSVYPTPKVNSVVCEFTIMCESTLLILLWINPIWKLLVWFEKKRSVTDIYLSVDDIPTDKKLYEYLQKCKSSFKDSFARSWLWWTIFWFFARLADV